MSPQQHPADDDEVQHKETTNDADDGDTAGSIFHESRIAVMAFEERVKKVSLRFGPIEGRVAEVVCVSHGDVIGGRR